MPLSPACQNSANTDLEPGGLCACAGLPDFRDLAEVLVDTARRAGDAILRRYDGNVEVEYKADNSPVTAADRAAEDIILADLARQAPDLPVIAEEKAAAGDLPVGGGRFFLVDPLDGTKEFIKRNGEFTVNIALVEDGTPRFGVIYAPALGRLFFTISETEAVETRLAASDKTPRLNTLPLKPLRVREPGPERLVAVASRSHINEATEAFLARHKIVETRSSGSSLKFCLVAAGEADVYPRLSPTNEWDTAAGHAILRAAGGTVLTAEGGPLLYGKFANKYVNPGFVAWGKPPA
jgi:3'(2'), 5'-bisphosphate nucleotidase